MWSYIAAVVLAAAVGYLVFAYVQGLGPGRQAETDLPAIGGSFTLVDQDGKTVTDRDLRGHLTLVYFGYTYCPDVCPTTLTDIADALDKLGPEGDGVVPLFITIDPARDTPEQLKMYVGHFSKRLIGLTGTEEQVAAAARAYRVYYAKVHEKGAAPDDYVMDHTSVIYLMGRDGKFLAHFTHDASPDDIAARIREYL